MVADYIRVSFCITYSNYPKRQSHFFFVFKSNNCSKLIKFAKEVAELDGGIFNVVSETLYINTSDVLLFHYKYYDIRESILSRSNYVQKQSKKRNEWINKTDEIWKKINKEKHE